MLDTQAHITMDLLRAIGAGRVNDDANLTPMQKESARWLYRHRFIDGAPLEGSGSGDPAMAELAGWGKEKQP